MSRSKDSKSESERATGDARVSMEIARRREVRALARFNRTGNPDHRRVYLQRAAESQKAAQAFHSRPSAGEVRDTGWQLLHTPHGPRFHREIGTSLHLDVEPQVADWSACAVEDRRLVKDGFRTGLRTQQEAARSIEIRMGVAEMPLPALTEGGFE